MELTTSLILAAAIHGFFLSAAIAILGFSKKQPGNLWFGALLFCLSLYLLEHFGAKTGFYASHPSLMLATYPMLFTIGPIFLIYYQISLGRKFGRTWKILLLSPTVVVYALLIPFYVANASAMPTSDSCPFATLQADFTYFSLLLDPLTFPIFTLILLGLTILERGRKFVAATPMVLIRRKWLKYLAYLLIAYFVLFFTSIFFRDFLTEIFPGSWDNLQFIGLSALIHFVTYLAILQPALFSNVKSVGATKYEKSSLDVQMSQLILKDIKKCIEENEAFLKSAYSLQQLSDDLDISRHRISQVINQEMGVTFLDYLNSCRIDKACEKLQMAGNEVVVNRLAIEVGFNNKVSFYRSFRKRTGMSPTDFREKYQIGVTSDRV
ncbi:MAG: helix-turn-helix domain-containing protein [Cyclobacteriaceae bacterium]